MGARRSSDAGRMASSPALCRAAYMSICRGLCTSIRAAPRSCARRSDPRRRNGVLATDNDQMGSGRTLAQNAFAQDAVPPATSPVGARQ
jgi:hypothetical protein